MEAHRLLYWPPSRGGRQGLLKPGVLWTGQSVGVLSPQLPWGAKEATGTPALKTKI